MRVCFWSLGFPHTFWRRTDLVRGRASGHGRYRAAFPVDVTLTEIEKYKGVYYDTDVVEACGKVIINK